MAMWSLFWTIVLAATTAVLILWILWQIFMFFVVLNTGLGLLVLVLFFAVSLIFLFSR